MTDETQQTPWTSITAEPSLKELLQKARREMTPEEIFEQRVSFVYGNLAMSNPDVTYEMVREVALAELPDKRLLLLMNARPHCEKSYDANATCPRNGMTMAGCRAHVGRKGENDDEWMEDDWAE